MASETCESEAADSSLLQRQQDLSKAMDGTEEAADFGPRPYRRPFRRHRPFRPYRPARKPHIVLILGDDYGWANLGVHREKAVTPEEKQAQKETQTPQMDALIKDGLLLERHYAYKICSPSRCSLQSGRLAVHVNTVNTGVSFWNVGDNVSGFAGIPRNMTGIGQKMQRGGYATHMVGKWDAGMGTPEHTPLGKGYDSWLGYFQHANDYWQESMPFASTGDLDICLNQFRDFSKYNSSYIGPVDRTVAAELGCDWDVRHDELQPDVYTEVNATGCNKNDTSYCLPDSCYEEAMFNKQALKIIEEHDLTKPLFLFYAPHLLHTPLQLPQSYLDQFEEGDLKDPEVPWTSNRRLYAGMTKYLDDMVGSVVEALKGRSEKGGTMYDNTLIVFTADNGGPVYEPGSANNHPLKGGKYSDWEGGVRTNAFVSGGYLPKHRRGKKFHGVISIADWYATFCELAGVSHFDEESEEANRYLVANGLPLLPPVDGRPQWKNLLENTNGRKDALHLSENALLRFPYKLVTGKQEYSFWQGVLYPNCTTVDDLKDGPLFSDMHCFGLDLYLSDNQTQQDELTYTQDCGDSGCLYNVELDPTEHKDLSGDPKYADALYALQLELYKLNLANFNPDRGAPALQACLQGADLGGFYGPFVDVTNFYKGWSLDLKQKEEAEAVKLELTELNTTLQNNSEAWITSFTESYGLESLAELFGGGSGLDNCSNST